MQAQAIQWQCSKAPAVRDTWHGYCTRCKMRVTRRQFDIPASASTSTCWHGILSKRSKKHLSCICITPSAPLCLLACTLWLRRLGINHGSGPAQAKADAARQAAEQQAAENAQLVAHLSLLEGEREAAQARPYVETLCTCMLVFTGYFEEQHAVFCLQHWLLRTCTYCDQAPIFQAHE